MIARKRLVNVLSTRIARVGDGQETGPSKRTIQNLESGESPTSFITRTLGNMRETAYAVPVAGEVDLFRVLADDDRLRIVRLLLDEPDGACVCEIVDALRLPQYEASRQLAILKGAGVVQGQRQGQWVYHRIPGELPELARSILDSLRQSLTGEPYREDRTRFRTRLTWRSAGLCVIGYDRESRYREEIPLRETTERGRGNAR